MPSRTDTRIRLLEAGSELVQREGLVDLARAVTAKAVADQAGVSTPTFFNHFNSVDDFTSELVEYVLAPDHVRSHVEVVREVLQGTDDVAGELRRAGRVDLEALVEDRWFAVELALWSAYRIRLEDQQQQADERLGELLNSLFHEMRQEWMELYQRTMQAWQLKPRPPFNLENIATIGMALAMGLAIFEVVDEEAVPKELPTVREAAFNDVTHRAAEELDGDPWGLFGTVIYAMLPIVTAPTTPRGGASLDRYDARAQTWWLRTQLGDSTPDSEKEPGGLEQLDDPDPEVRAAAARSLSLSLDEPETAERLLECLREDPEPQVRTAAIQALSPPGSNREVVDAILEHADDQAQEVRRAVAVALGRADQSPGVLGALVQLLDDHIPEVRTAAARALRPLAQHVLDEYQEQAAPGYPS